MAPLSAAEKQKKYRERLKENPEKYEEAKSKHRAHYHKVKRLAKDLTPQEKKQANSIWKLRQREYRKKKNLRFLFVTPSSPVPALLDIYNSPQGSPASPVSQEWGCNKLITDQSKVYRENKKLQEENKKLKKCCEKYKKRLVISKIKEIESKVEKVKQNYRLLANSIKERYEKVKSHKEKRLLKKLSENKDIGKSKGKSELVQETLGIKRVYENTKTTLQQPMLLQKKIHEYFLRDDVSRATAGKKETVAQKQVKVQKRYLLDAIENLYADFKEENIDM